MCKLHLSSFFFLVFSADAFTPSTKTAVTLDPIAPSAGRALT